MSLNSCTLTRLGVSGLSSTELHFSVAGVCHQAMEQPLVKEMWAVVQRSIGSVRFEASIDSARGLYLVDTVEDQYVVKVCRINEREALYGVICALFIISVDFLKKRDAITNSQLNYFGNSGVAALSSLYFDRGHLAGFKKAFLEKISTVIDEEAITSKQIINEMIALTPINNLADSIHANCKGEDLRFVVTGLIDTSQIILELEDRKCKLVNLCFPEREHRSTKEYAQLVLAKLIEWSFITYNEDCTEVTLAPVAPKKPFEQIFKAQYIQTQLKEELRNPSHFLYLLLSE